MTINLNAMRWLFITLVLLVSCKNENAGSWGGGKITEPGKYIYNDASLVIQIAIENGFVKYGLYNSEGVLLAKNDYRISTYQNWAFYLDEDLNFWVFSSDIGHSVWEKDLTRYYHHTFEHKLRKDEVSEKLYNECKEFFYDK